MIVANTIPPSTSTARRPPLFSGSSDVFNTMSDDDNPNIMETLESLMRITLAGFGGALAGISISRRGGLMTAQQQALAKATSNNVVRQQSSRQQHKQTIRSAPPVLRPSTDRDLPTAWAVACMAFAGVVEFTRLISPTTFASQFIAPPLEEAKTDSSVEFLQTNKSTGTTIPHAKAITIIDYAIGGGIAGALFKGSAVRTPAGARIDASIMGNSYHYSQNTIKSRPLLSGILPGVALGLLAGVTIVTMEYAQVVAEEMFGIKDAETDNADSNDTVEEIMPKNKNDDIPADIKEMSSEELITSIQNLKSGRDESRSKKVQVKSELHEEQRSSTKNKVTDILYVVGFRRHPSS